MSLFAGIATNEPVTGPDAPVDWEARKAEILSRLDLVAEYDSLGVRFVSRVPGARGCLECHSVDRPDESPSAVVFVPSGVYHDSGSASKAMGFFDFALKHGDFGRFGDVLKFYAEKAGVPFGRMKAHDQGGFREATFLYRDADGGVSYAAFRYKLPTGKKRFSLHPSDGRGGWKYGKGCMAGIAPLPYRLPELLASDPDEYPVYIVEGEKVAERAARLGLVASTNHMGSDGTEKTWPHFLEYFRDRTCYVLPDNDDVGRKHAAKVCGYLRGVARSVKFVELPGQTPSGDLCDWLDMGHDIEELAVVAHSTPEWALDASEAASPEPLQEEEPEDDGLPPDDDVQTVCLADVVAVPVEWLWPDRVPLGKLTLLAGEAKLGKSFLTMDLIARVSAGLEIPGSPGECMPRGSIVLLSAEDDLADTVKPRLVACGADFARVHALTTIRMANGKLGPFNLSYVPHLERAILRARDCLLVVIDPVPHYVGNGTDDHKNAQTRQLLEPLKDLANRLRIAVLMVTHLNKGTGTKALNRVTGSGAYTALARANWMVIKDSNDPKRRLFLSAGTNLVEEPSGLAYRIGRESGRVEWEDAPVLMTADDALAASMESRKDEGGKQPKAGKLEAARDFIIEVLAEGKELARDDLDALGAARGIKPDDIWKAKESAGARTIKKGFQGKWYWSIPLVGPLGEREEPIF